MNACMFLVCERNEIRAVVVEGILVNVVDVQAID